jgi:hypothetical protein
MESASQEREPAPRKVLGKPFQAGGDPRRHMAGRPSKNDEIRQLEKRSRQYTMEALERLVGPALMTLQKAIRSRDDATALRAALRVIEYSAGLPISTVNANISQTESVTYVTPELLRAAALRLLAADATDAEEADGDRD